MCYAVPVISGIFTSAIWSKTKSIKIWWLNLLLWGGGIFGFVDHLWNRELFLISGNIARDLMLGAVITVAICASWAAMLWLAKLNPTLASYVKIETK